MKTVHAFRIAALATALFLGACDLLEEDSKEAPGESGLTSPWVGKPLDSLVNVTDIAVRGGRLYVANAHATSPGVAVVDTSTNLIVAYYPEIINPASMAFTAEGGLVVAETDYTQGGVSVIDTAAKRIRKSVIAFGTDPGVQAEDGKVYLFDHTSGAVTGFTGATPGKSVVFDVQAGAGSNPYGIAVSGGKAYITRYNSASLLILGDASALGGGTRDSIDLSAYVSRKPADSAASAPRMAAVTAQGGYVFVALQRLNYKYSALDTSLVVVINAATKTVEKTIPLLYRNPVAATVDDGVWYITGIAAYGSLTGGVERIDLATRTHAGTVVTETVLGGDAFDFAPVGAGAGRGYVSWSTDFGTTTKVKKVAY